MKPALAFKVLDRDRWSCHGEISQWPEPGVWTRTITNPAPGVRGWNLYRTTRELYDWLGPEIWVAEWDSDAVNGPDGMVVSRARLIRRTRWDERAARLFGADCAERVLPLFETAVPSDPRPRRAIEAARAHARGEISAAAMATAGAWAADAAARPLVGVGAWSAAKAAAKATARDAAQAATGAARAAAAAVILAAAEATAGDAAKTARAAARDAGTAAWAAERSWQAARLTDALGLTPDEAAVLAPALGEDQEVSV